MKIIREEDLSKIALGATVLASGGGGNPEAGVEMAKQAIRKYGPVPLIKVEDLPGDATIACISMMGSTEDFILDNLPEGNGIRTALQQMEKEIGRKVDAIMPIEVGGFNLFTPLVAANLFGIPVVDADSLGRAFPELQMTTFLVDGIFPTPITAGNEKGEAFTLQPSDPFEYEREARKLTILQEDRLLSLVDFCVTGQQVKESALPKAFSKSLEIGYQLEEPSHLGYEIFQGWISKVNKNPEKTGFLEGNLTIQGWGNYENKTMEINFKNEYLLATSDGKLKATTPDIITLLADHRPITTDQIAENQVVTVIVLPSPKKWRTPKGLQLVGPRYFGFGFDYLPIEKLRQEVTY